MFEPEQGKLEESPAWIITQAFVDAGIENPQRWAIGLDPLAFDSVWELARAAINRHFRLMLADSETNTANIRMLILDSISYEDWKKLICGKVVPEVIKLGVLPELPAES